METWPARSRGLMGGILQGSWGIGFLLSSAVYGLFFNYIGWRGMLWIGVLPAVAVLWVRRYVKEREVWVENRRRQRVEHREVRVPLVSIFKRGLLGNTLTACWCRQHRRIRGKRVVGLGFGSYWPPLGYDHPSADRDTRGASICSPTTSRGLPSASSSRGCAGAAACNAR